MGVSTGALYRQIYVYSSTVAPALRSLAVVYRKQGKSDAAQVLESVLPHSKKEVRAELE